MKKKSISIIDVLLSFAAVALCFGTVFIFHPCGPKPDGSWMLCHWAERVIVAMGATFFALCAVRFFVSRSIKTGISICFIAFSIITMLVPGVLINLCMMHSMRCWTVMKPAVTVISILIAVLSSIDVIISIVKKDS